MQSNKNVIGKEFTFTTETDGEEVAKAIVHHIQAEENALQTGLEEMYTNMSAETFRSMRRVMTVTRNKMEWNVNAIRMVRQVRK